MGRRQRSTSSFNIRSGTCALVQVSWPRPRGHRTRPETGRGCQPVAAETVTAGNESRSLHATFNEKSCVRQGAPPNSYNVVYRARRLHGVPAPPRAVSAGHPAGCLCTIKESPLNRAVPGRMAFQQASSALCQNFSKTIFFRERRSFFWFVVVLFPH